MELKTSAFKYYINRLNSLLLSRRKEILERNIFNGKYDGFFAGKITKLIKHLGQKYKRTKINKIKT